MKNLTLKLSLVLRNLFAIAFLVTILGTVVLGILLTNSEIKNLAYLGLKFLMVSSIFAIIHHLVEHKLEKFKRLCN